MAVTNPLTDSVGQRCGVAKCLGDNNGGTLYFAYRTSGPYGTSDGNLIRSTVTWSASNSQAWHYYLITDLQPETTYYWGATAGSDITSVAGQFTTTAEPATNTGNTKLPGIEF